MEQRLISIDIETLGINSNSPILSIGACDNEGRIYYTNLDVQSQIENGAVTDWSTVHWWMHQSEAARASLHEFGLPPREALFQLSAEFEWDKAEVWVNGLNFDIPILENAYKRFGMNVPWKYTQCRDLRTLVKLLPHIQKHKPAVAHNALSDAEAQLATLTECLKSLKQLTAKV